MTTDATLETFYEGWETYQKHLTAAIAPLSPEQLDLRAAPTLRSIRTIVLHIIGARVRWFHVAAGAGGPEIEPLGAWDRPDAPIRTTVELVSGLETSWSLMKGALATWTPDDLQTPFQMERHGEVHTLTRQWIVWHVLEHDLHHGGEVSFSLGMHNLPGLDI